MEDLFEIIEGLFELTELTVTVVSWAIAEPVSALVVAVALYIAGTIAYKLWQCCSAGDGPSTDRYRRAYRTNPALQRLPNPDAASGAAQGLPSSKFLLTVKQHLERDYVLLVDRSGSMCGRRWAQAEEAVTQLAPYICRFDPDGADVYFFDDEVVECGSVTTAGAVAELFHQHQPRGSTDLAAALDAAFRKHFAGSRGATTILVVTDGAPDSRAAVERVIRKAANSLELDAELSVSFIQIGDARSATEFLRRLDDDLDGAKFDIVDTVTAAALKGMSFNELIANSIYD